MELKPKKPVIILACTGLGKINRGYESFTRECFDNLKHTKDFDLFLLKGAGKNQDKEITIFNISRQRKLAGWLSKLIRKDAYFIEQLTFSMGMLPLIIKRKPSLIYFSDFSLGTFLWHLRVFFKFKYKLLFSNGAPNGPPFSRTDHVQQLLPMYIQEAIAVGTPENKQTLLPYAVNFSVAESLDNLSKQQQIRQQLQLPVDKKIVISVGAVNCHHKRMDYVINEFSSLDLDKYFLIILGQIDNNSKEVIKLAEEKLKQGSYLIKQVTNIDVKSYLFAADYFILASLSEGLPRVLPEAMSAGLLPIVHDYAVTRETLECYGIFKDLKKSSILSQAIQEVNERQIPREEVIFYAWDKYSWEQLKERYTDMIETSC